MQPQGTLDRANAPRSRVRITVLTILALHVVFIGGLLLQGGCNPTKPGANSAAANASSNSLTTLPGLTDPNTNSFYTSFPGDTAANPATNHASSPAPGLAGAGAAPAAAGAGASIPSAVGADPNAGAGAGAGGFVPAANNNTAFAAPSFGNPAGNLAPVPAAGTATEHVIKSGDTVRDLAKKYGVSEKAILEANPALNPRKLRVEAKINIPAPAPSTPAAAGGASAHGAFVANEAAAGGEQYVVKPGDTLAKIAKKYGVTVKQIMAANGMKNDRIVPKQKLTIPAKAAAVAPAAAPAAHRPAGANTTF